MNVASRNDPEELISKDAFRLGFLHWEWTDDPKTLFQIIISIY